MSFLSSLICAFFMSPVQGAPSDVPKNHWAYGAVNELFENGLLKGYPAEGKTLTLQKAVFDQKKAIERHDRWKREAIFVNYPNVLYRVQREPSRYEFAVEVYSVYSRRNDLDDPKIREVFTKELPEIAHQISMFQFELTKLGENPKQMVADLEEFRQAANRRFDPLTNHR